MLYKYILEQYNELKDKSIIDLCKILQVFQAYK